MVYIIDTNGTTQAVNTEPIYQGSTGVNNITLLAPFPANYQITISVILPNGIPLRNVYPMQPIVLPTVLQDINKNNYTCFVATVDELMTEYAGTVQVQFNVIQGIGKRLNTYTTGFSVGVGIPTEDITLPSDTDDIAIILGYLAELNADPVKSVLYTTKAEYIINNQLIAEGNGSVSVYPASLTNYSGVFTVEGMTSQLNGPYFFFSSNVANSGFTIDLGQEYSDLFLIQLYMYSQNVDNTITVQASTDNINYEPIGTDIINATTRGVLINPRFTNSSNCRYIRVIFSNGAVVRGVQLFKQNLVGEYVITFRSGATATIEAVGWDVATTAQMALNTANSALDVANNAQNSADTAQSTANNAQSTADTAQSTADTAQNTANSAQRLALDALAAIPRVYFEKGFNLIVGTCFYSPIKNGDVLINLEPNTPDFLVFAVGQFSTEGATVLTLEMLQTGTLPTPSVGDIYLIKPIAGGSPQFGIIAIESGGVTATVDGDTEPTPDTIPKRDTIGSLYAKNSDFFDGQVAGYLGEDQLINAKTLEVYMDYKLGNVETMLSNIISRQENYINGGTE